MPVPPKPSEVNNLFSDLSDAIQNRFEDGGEENIAACVDTVRTAFGIRADTEENEHKVLLRELRAYTKTSTPETREKAYRKVRSLLSVLPDALVGAGWGAQVKERQWVVQGHVPAGELSLLSGPGSVGKSLLVLQMACGLACDRTYLAEHGGWLPKIDEEVDAEAPALMPNRAITVFANWEDGIDEALRRRNRLVEHGGCDWAGHESINEKLHVLPMRGFGPVWSPSEGGHVSTLGTFTKAGKVLLKYAERVEAQLLVLDPVGLALFVDENHRSLVSSVLDKLSGWANKTNCAVLLTGHPAKAREGEASDYSGSTAWRGSVRALLTLKKPTDKEADLDSLEYTDLAGKDEAKQERVALFQRNKNNYDWDDVGLTVATVGGRAGWCLADPLPKPKSGTTPKQCNTPGCEGTVRRNAQKCEACKKGIPVKDDSADEDV